MSANDTLNRLVSQMSVEERLALLDRIRENSTISLEPLYVQGEEDAQRVSFEEQYKRLPWFVRLFYRLVGIFTGKAAAKVYENGRMLLMARKIEASAPGVFDYQQNRLLDGFFVLLCELKDAARFFYNVLDTSINKDRGAFYAILGSLEMEDVHLRLQGECGPQAALDRNPYLLSANLRPAVMRAMDEALISITDAKRGAMYYHARSLGYLKELSCFLFDRFILAFEESQGARSCRISASVREMLASLDRILFSLRDPPALSLFESLFVYELETRAGEPGFDTDREMRSLLERASGALETIRGFNTKIPLTRIIRCASQDIGYRPAQISGGEDWFQVYRGYWKQQLENALAEYFAEKKRMDIVRSLEDFFGAQPEPLANAAPDSGKDGFPLPEAFALSFLKAFHSVLNGGVNAVLRPIIMDGDFARREDRIGLTEAYNDVMHAAERIQALDEKLSPSGEHGKRYALARQETEGLPVKRRKMQFVQNDASKEAWGIISRSRDGMRKMAEQLEVILNQDLGGEHGGISNFAKLAGKNPAPFARGIAEAVGSLQKALQVLSDISAMSRPS